MAVRIQVRRDTAANWTAANPVLGQGEEGYVTDTGELKFGDGVTAWDSLVGQLGPPSSRVIGPSNGTDDTAWINALLASAGSFQATAGQTYKVSAPLVLPSNTTLDLTGATIAGAAGWVGSNMITNHAALAANAVRTATDVTTTAGSTTIGSVTGFTSAEVGRIVVMATGNLGTTSTFTATIVSQAGATAVLTSAPSATVSGAHMSVYNRDHNITLRGSISALINRGATGSPADDNRQHALLFRRIDGFRLAYLSHLSTDAKYAVSLGDITNFEVTDQWFNNYSDGLHLLGPMSKGKISRLYGTSGDDFLAMGCSDYSQYADVQGDLTDIEIEGLLPASGVRHLHIFGGSTGTAFVIDRIQASGFYGATTQASILVEQGDVTGTPTIVDNITLGDIYSGSTGNNPVVQLGGTTSSAMGSVSIRNFHRNSTTDTVDFIRVISPTVLRTLQIDGLTVIGSPPTQGIVKILGTLGSLMMRGVDVAMGGGAAPLVAANGQVTNVEISDATVGGSGPSYLFYTNVEQAALSLRLANITLSGFAGQYPLWLQGAVALDMRGVDLGTCYEGIYMASVTTVVTVTGTGITIGDTSTHPVGGSAGSVVHSRTFDMPVDLNQNVGATLGDRAYNVNAGAAAGIGPVIYNGAAWINLATFADLLATANTWALAQTFTTGVLSPDISATGSGATLRWDDRAEGSTHGWLWYANNGVAYLYKQFGGAPVLSASESNALTAYGVFFPVQAATGSAPAYVKGGVYFDTTLNKLRIGGASGWETVTSV